MKMSDGLNGISAVALVNSSPLSVVPCPSAVGTMTTLNNISAGGALNCNSLSPTSMANLATVVNNHVNASNAMNNVVTTNGNGVNHLSHHQLNNMNMNINHMNNTQNTQNMADYLAQLIKDKKQLAIFPNLFMHLDRILDEEIARVRGNLFHLSGTKVEPLELPEPLGPVITSSEKVYVPVKEHPDFNFVGRILGPRGMTAKQLEQETGCKIMVRGKGSMRDKKKEEQNRGKPNWEHLNDELHVLITVEDTDNRATCKLARAVEEVKKLLIPAEGEDELKKRQLMELAIINGTYRDSKESRNAQAAVSAAAAQLVSPQVPLSALRAATPLGFYGFLKHKNMMESLQHSPYLGQLDQQTHLLNFDGITGAPLIISPHHRLSNGLNNAAAAAAAAGHQQLLAQGGGDSLLYAASPYTTADYATYLQLAEYPPEHVGKMNTVRRLTGLRDLNHPYLPKSDPASLLH